MWGDPSGASARTPTASVSQPFTCWQEQLDGGDAETWELVRLMAAHEASDSIEACGLLAAEIRIQREMVAYMSD